MRARSHPGLHARRRAPSTTRRILLPLLASARTDISAVTLRLAPDHAFLFVGWLEAVARRHRVAHVHEAAQPFERVAARLVEQLRAN